MKIPIAANVSPNCRILSISTPTDCSFCIVARKPLFYHFISPPSFYNKTRLFLCKRLKFPHRILYTIGNQKKRCTMKKVKQILAIIGVILLVGLYLSTFILAIFGDSNTMNLFKASIVATVIIPVLIWAYSMIYRLLKTTIPSGRIFPTPPPPGHPGKKTAEPIPAATDAARKEVNHILQFHWLT